MWTTLSLSPPPPPPTQNPRKRRLYCGGTDGNDQRKWTTSIKGRRRYLCANFFSCLINVNKICQNFPGIQCHVTAVGSQQNRVFVFMWFKMAMSFAESWKSLTLKLSFMCWGRTDFGITPVEKGQYLSIYNYNKELYTQKCNRKFNPSVSMTFWEQQKVINSFCHNRI